MKVFAHAEHVPSNQKSDEKIDLQYQKKKNENWQTHTNIVFR